MAKLKQIPSRDDMAVITPRDDVEQPCDAEERRPTPEQWEPVARLRGSAICECQGFDAWTKEEQELWQQGKLRIKWGIGQVSVRMPVRGIVSQLAVTYGFLPFIVPGYLAVWTLWTYLCHGRPSGFAFFGSCAALFFTLVNELITKQLCKRLFGPKMWCRPPEAVCKHPGMPSGHVMCAYTLMFWLLLEIATERIIYPEWLVGMVLLMGPVPWARVQNKDHTIPQVLISSGVACVLGTLVYHLRLVWEPTAGKDDPWVWLHASDGILNPFM